MSRTMSAAQRGRGPSWKLFMIVLTLVPYATSARANDNASGGEWAMLRGQIESIKTDEQSERRGFDSDEQRIRGLELQLQRVQTENQKLSGTAQELAITNIKLRAGTEQQIRSLEQRVSSGVSLSQFDSAFRRYLGTINSRSNGRT
jgi:TolA-binding protein